VAAFSSRVVSMIKEYLGFSPSLYPITEPIVVHTSDFAGNYIWLLIPEISCSPTISGSDNNQNILLFIKLQKKTGKINHANKYDPSEGGKTISNEELIQIAQERSPEFFGWLMFHADIF